MNNLLSIAKIVNFHGIKGDVKVGYTKGKESQLLSITEMLVSLPEGVKTLNVVNIRFHKGFAIIKFKEINSINDAELYKGLHLYISAQTVKNNLEKDEYLVSELDGLEVYDTQGNILGVVSAVGENSAGNLLSVKDKNGKFHLIPFVKELVPMVDIKKKKLVINNIEGLIN